MNALFLKTVSNKSSIKPLKLNMFLKQTTITELKTVIITLLDGASVIVVNL
jgi:hypothetical protein